MFEKLSSEQKKVVNCLEPRIIVKACPGSGKTFSVTARLAKLIENNKLNRHQGIAAISFTNGACDEIQKGIKKFRVNSISYPNFIGTIDNFINTYIFLPYGHLFMRCKKRPEIVGTEYNKWFNYDSTKINYRSRKILDPNYYFDKVSFNIDDDPIPILHSSIYHFSWNEITNSNGELKKVISDINDIKKYHFRSGKAIQADANYIAYKILKKFPLIANNIVQKFPILIIDEAQDTTAIQMAIIDLLDNANAKSILLVGDPDQAIFEWNTADPSLFMEKFNNPNWTHLKLEENRRSSNNICQLINHFFNDTIISASENDMDYPEKPLLIEHTNETNKIIQIKDCFVSKCKTLRLKEDDCAVVYRGKIFGEKHFGLTNETETNINKSPWCRNYYYVRDIVQGKYLIDNGNFKKGFNLIEKGFFKMKENQTYISNELIRNKINSIGFRKYRKIIFNFINNLPDTNCTLSDWIKKSKQNKLKFYVENSNSNDNISNYFHDEKIVSQNHNKLYKTIHSVKGKSLEAILVFISDKAKNYNYATLFNSEYNMLPSAAQEELRILYVACTRPKKILWIAVPSKDLEIWKKKLFINL